MVAAHASREDAVAKLMKQDRPEHDRHIQWNVIERRFGTNDVDHLEQSQEKEPEMDTDGEIS